ncbi:S8 family serine peptidase [Brevundimonas sp.]|uniref:S8 family serine peptidase n=1 Tax=Brevundimonas sp. TaxID=1871086 RepID=UPI0025E00113|nr:S8 family serine peptidase [Brevundimonas sp.]
MRFDSRQRLSLILAVLAMAAAGAAQAQIGGVGPGLPTLPGLPGAPSTPLPDITRPLDGRLLNQVTDVPSRFQDLVRRSRGALEADPQGWPVVRSEILVMDMSPEVRDWAAENGYVILREERLETLGLTTTVLAPPRRTRLARAIEQLQSRDPSMTVEYNHVYAPSGATGEAFGAAATVSLQSDGAARLGLIDTGVDAGHPSLAGVRLRQRGFSGDARAGAHGTAVASIMVGNDGRFAGVWPGAGLLAADIYGGRRDGGGSAAFAQALDWLAGEGVTVVNVSLVGPHNAVVERAVERAQGRGVTVVAAAGNDGPAAPPLYPASYDGVVGVSAVSASGRILPEAARGPQVDFAAPGSDMAAASPGGGYTSVRGASFAAPVVAAFIARNGGGRTGLSVAMRSAVDAGERGPDPVYGAGIVGADLRVEPRAVQARGRLTN